MSKHDQQRKDGIAKTLLKAKEQTETALLYLQVDDGNMDQIFEARLVIEHIDIALEHLGASLDQSAT